MNKLTIVTPLHIQTKRDYIGRMMDEKVHCMQIAKMFGQQFWDGGRRYGYGGYHYDGRWKSVALKLLEQYNLPPDAKILDVGCGKGYLLFEFLQLLPDAEIHGFDIASYAISNAKEEIKSRLIFHDAKDPFPYPDKSFDLVVSLGTLHNLPVHELSDSISEMERVGRQKYLMVESFRSEQELFNLQCWALTCETFFRPEGWLWIMEQSSYTGDYEFIYFE